VHPEKRKNSFACQIPTNVLSPNMTEANTG
jgi:hypothetical protein